VSVIDGRYTSILSVLRTFCGLTADQTKINKQAAIVDPRRFNDIAALIARTFADAATTLTQIKARRRYL
jgi:hypothetical protein